MDGSVRIARWLALALALALLVLGGAFAREEQEEECVFFANSDIPNAAEIINFKGRLNEYGFYVSGVSDTDLRSTDLDPSTLAAVIELCQYNPDLTAYSDRVSYRVYWRVIGQDPEGKKLVTPANSVHIYDLIAPGENAEAVSELQTRLSNLGYDEAAGFQYTAGLYDAELDRALRAFVELNNLYGAYDPEAGITPTLQEKIFQQEPEPVHYVAPKEKMSEKVMGFMTGSSVIGGVKIPNVALLVAGFVLLCVIVILILRLVAPGTGKAKKIKLHVEYRGKVLEYSVPVAPVIEIGRAVGNFPLNTNDASISRRHAEIRCSGGKYTFVDHSTYGSKVNGAPCHNDERQLHSGDILEIGDHKITLQMD